MCRYAQSCAFISVIELPRIPAYCPKEYPFNVASPVIADPFHRMKYMERHGSGLRKIVRETEKPPRYTAAYNPEIFSTATDFRVLLKNINYQLSQKNLVNDQVSEQDKSTDIPHAVLNLCIFKISRIGHSYTSIRLFLRQ